MGFLPAYKLAHAQALVAWNGMEYGEAIEMAKSKSCEEIEQYSYANGSIVAAKAGIEKHLLGGKEIDARYLTGELTAPEGYFEGLKKNIEANVGQDGIGKGIMSILGDIHDVWVQGNAKKYDRDAEKGDKRLFQHLPTQLIGKEEVAKDLMFLAPILSEIGIQVGTMEQSPYGAFVPTEEVAEAYDSFSKDYLDEHEITPENIGEKMPEIINGYSALHGDSPVDIARHAYMSTRTDLLAQQVKENLNLNPVESSDIVQ